MDLTESGSSKLNPVPVVEVPLGKETAAIDATFEAVEASCKSIVTPELVATLAVPAPPDDDFPPLDPATPAVDAVTLLADVPPIEEGTLLLTLGAIGAISKEGGELLLDSAVPGKLLTGKFA